MMTMTADTLKSGHRCIRLVGRLDIAGVQTVDLAFTSHVAGSKQSVLVDMSGVEFVASIGIRMFFTNARTLGLHGAKMVVLNPQPMVEQTLKLAGVDMMVPIQHDLAAAEQMLVTASQG
jgi:anti-anti-sigma factor